MKRIIFTQPIPYTEQAMNLELLIRSRDGALDDTDLADLLNIKPREVRHIVERLNYNKFKGIDNDYQYKKINGKYTIIDLQSPFRNKVINRLKFDLIASAKRFHITANKLGDVNLMNMTMKELLSMEEEDE